jgi:F-type H+-transporting ATPase subunit a
LLELIAEIARLVSFSARLFGNMLAGEILIFVMTFLVGLAAPILIIFYGLEVFVGAIQAFVFGALTLVFAMLAIAGHDEGEHGHEEEAHGH